MMEPVVTRLFVSGKLRNARALLAARRGAGPGPELGLEPSP